MFHVQKHQEASLIEVGDDLDCFSAPALESAIALIEAADETAVVSLEHCDYCDSSGLAVLIKAKKRLGSRLVIVVPEQSKAYRIFTLTDLLKPLDIKGERPDAIDVAPLAP